MNSNPTIRAALQLLERRLLPAGHEEALNQAAFEREIVKLQGDRAPAKRLGHWKARIELTVPQECEGER